ncbi:hypothetical protein SAMN04487948_12049 [Halogranum amylolyticum]|uniref:NrS-1 polymerase-like HBD domain-containing protein n=1 Tax=Halogranum amylolyticum TaxID=660520 RepID=A0A1H8VWG6_9EURY|nr:hypothetical protein [Halogranum amylolyticum]SEP19739.1 hypothetical protein SAMN04487948_12049 [Halogranum amylolyticum]
MTEEPTETLTQESIPDELVERPQWVCWRREQRDGKATKIPVVPGVGSFASSTDPETWADFETARDYLERGRADGIGFVFTEEDPIVGVDLDDCRDSESGDTDDDAQDIITRLDSYTEVSPSGTGYHVLIQGSLPEGRNRRGKIECYDTARFFTVTGDRVTGTPTAVSQRQDALEAIHREYIADEETSTQATDSPTDVTQRDETTPNTSLDDDTLLEKASSASNGEKFDRLWNGSTSGYDSNSEADMALCCLLAFWSGGDAAQMDQLFRQSGLIREKWDEVHYADGSTYGEKTIERAIERTAEFYEPRSAEQSETDTPTTDGDDADETRSRAYLVEKTRLLRERVNTLEATLDKRDERIEELEAEVARLTDADTAQTETSDVVDDDGHTEATDDEADSETSSLWGRTKRLLGTDAE